jgi:hypothetical protein
MREINERMRNIIIAYCIALVLVCIYVPWKIDSRGYRESVGYSFLWSIPKTTITQKDIDLAASYGLSKPTPQELPAVVDFYRIFLEIFAITVLAGLGLYLMQSKK